MCALIFFKIPKIWCLEPKVLEKLHCIVQPSVSKRVKWPWNQIKVPNAYHFSHLIPSQMVSFYCFDTNHCRETAFDHMSRSFFLSNKIKMLHSPRAYLIVFQLFHSLRLYILIFTCNYMTSCQLLKSLATGHWPWKISKLIVL